jgi:hypothetical protein
MIKTWLETASLTKQQHDWLDSFRQSSEYAKLPDQESVLGIQHPLGWSGQWRLRLACEAFHHLIQNDFDTAFEIVQRSLDDTSLEAEPLEGTLEQLGIRLAEQTGDEQTVLAFTQRLQQYTEHFLEPSGVEAIFGWNALFEDDTTLWLDRLFEPGDIPPPLERYLPAYPVPFHSPDQGSTGLYRGSENLPTTSQLERPLTVHILLEPRQGKLASCQVVVHDTTIGTPLGRLDAQDRFLADLELVFKDSDLALLEQLYTDSLELRLVFVNGRYWDFTSANNTLVCTLNSELGLIKLSLELPQLWLERDVPLGLILNDLEGMLLIPKSG